MIRRGRGGGWRSKVENKQKQYCLIYEYISREQMEKGGDQAESRRIQVETRQPDGVQKYNRDKTDSRRHRVHILL
jgi:hypothetical protein